METQALLKKNCCQALLRKLLLQITRISYQGNLASCYVLDHQNTQAPSKTCCQALLRKHCCYVAESLKEAVGHEDIKLLVSVDEGDYEKGRVKLLQNLLD